MPLHFKVQSCSSQTINNPASNLISRNGYWQSQRFCDYPVQLTIAFYHAVKLRSIKIVSHPQKVTSRINILYHLTQHKDKQFQRFGFLTLSEHKDNLSSTEVKEISEVNIKATEIRLVLLRNYQSKANFFNQVGLAGLQFQGEIIDHVMPSIDVKSKKGFESQTTLLMQLKRSFVRREQFQQAKQVKEMQLVLERANEQIRQLQEEKLRCVSNQDFTGASRVRDQLKRLRLQVSELASKFYDPQGRVRMYKSDVALKQKMEEMRVTSKSSTFKLKESRRRTEEAEPLVDVGEVLSEDDENDDHNQSMISYDDRILPAVMNKLRGASQANPVLQASEVGDNQFFDAGEKTNLPAQPQQMGAADEANSSVLLQFYQPIFVRKLHSKFWQFRLQAITQATQQLKEAKDPQFLTKQRLRCYLFIYLQSLKIPNFKTTSAVLQMMDLVAQGQGEDHKELHNQLEATLKATLRILADSNQKIRTHAEKTVMRIVSGQVFGVHPCYGGLIKHYPEKGIGRLRKIRIQNLMQLVQKYGVGQHGVPQSVADFALKAASDPQVEVRKSGVELAKVVKAKGGKHKIQNLLADSRIKSSVAKQLTN